jgi:hypothetical protein
MVLPGYARCRCVGEDSGREEGKDGEVRAGDGASIGNAKPGHEKMQVLSSSLGHDVLGQRKLARMASSTKT